MPTTLSPVERKHFTRSEYHFLADSGLLDDARYELLNGDILAQMPQKEPHDSLVMAIVFLMARLFGDGYLRCQMPVVLSNDGEPEPDIAVTAQERAVYQNGSTPTSAEVRLLIEVSVSTLAYDTGEKAVKYAQSGVPEYWVVDTDNRRLVVYRNPSPTGYAAPIILTDADTATPLAAPNAIISVKDLLP
ncbi:MAG: Uma2 family endonuclease [Armatimonadetes bacterium]|nr:Uma2 family endonuclease [Armatimonadota bacterium]